MIRTFADRRTEDVYLGNPAKGLSRAVQRAAQRRLEYLQAARQLDDLRAPPGNRLEKLMGNLAGRHSMRVNDQWRIIFEWHDGDAYLVEIIDYH
ncbi:MAG: type II toxin-antitoxin system RelE/ParE family toxin [Planctomycetaceae bacterium]